MKNLSRRALLSTSVLAAALPTLSRAQQATQPAAAQATTPAAAQAAKPAAAQAAKPAVDQALLNTPSPLGDMAMGPDAAKVTVIEYASATCPHCAAFSTKVFPELKKEYIDTGKIRYIFREFPLNDAATAGAMVARCAPKDKFFSVVEEEFATLEKWSQNPLEGLRAISKNAGMTNEEFEACLKNETVVKGIYKNRELGEKLGVDGTPFFFINGTPMSGEKTMEEFRKIIDPLLK